MRPGQLVVTRKGHGVVASWLVHVGGGVVFALPGYEELEFSFRAGDVPQPELSPPRELESMSTAEVAEYLKGRIEADAGDRLLDGCDD